ncbi:AMIN domain-containing protein [Gynuella sunshinyii]|uniref:AMIN domain-containing protein n=1 Tax=Gynuella sunshinyii TaxID=1445505 RepID=UPI00069A9C38|nr:AMIN domain-containing protein [Gynuella sunshinyii]
MRVLNRLIKVLLLLVPATGALAVNVTNIEFSSLAGDRTEVRLTFDGSFQSPKSYSVEQPARISIDLPDVASSLQKYYQVSSGNTRSATVLNAGDRTRVVLNLTKLVPYTLAKTGNQLVILIGEQSGSAAEVAQLVSDSPIEMLGDNQEISLLGDEENEVIDIAGANTQGTASQASKPAASASKSVQQVDFRRGEEADGQVIIAFSDSTANADIHEESGNIVVRVPGFTLPETLQRRLDVVDFATAVRYINAYNEGKDAVFVIEPGSNYEYLAYQTNKVLTIDVKEVTQEEQEKRLKEKFPYNGERLSLNFQDIAVRSVLQLIADFTELNLVASDTIQGNITLRLKNVPWDQALDLVLKTKGLDKREIGNVLLVAPAEEIAAREKLELEAQAQIEKLAPLSTEFIQINYAKATDIVDIIQKQSKAEVAADAAVGQATGADTGASVASSTLLSARGTIAVDERTNKIMVRDTASNLEKIRQAIAVFDVPVRQVLIEARIVVANSTVGK